MSLTSLPRRVSWDLRLLGPCFHYWHRLVFSWLFVLHLFYGGSANFKSLARHGPAHWPTTTTGGCGARRIGARRPFWRGSSS
jgi:hypothetical protein